MKTILFSISILLLIVLEAKAQFVTNKTVLYKLELKDSLLQSQLDSILFVKNICPSTSSTHVYFITIKEKQPDVYSISIEFKAPARVEDDVNTGIYINKNRTYIIREESTTSLFSSSGEKQIFRYDKLVMKISNDSHYFREALAPADYCFWNLSYSEYQLKVLNLENVRGAQMYYK